MRRAAPVRHLSRKRTRNDRRRLRAPSHRGARHDAAARHYHRGALVVAFQPHRYTRTAYLAAEFADALRGADRIYLTPVYAASEPAIPGVSERSIGESLATNGTRVNYVNSVEELERRILAEAPVGAMVLMLGAGDITEVAGRLAASARG